MDRRGGHCPGLRAVSGTSRAVALASVAADSCQIVQDTRSVVNLLVMSPFAPQSPASFSRIFVGGVPRGTTEDELRGAFALTGTLVGNIEFVVDRSTGVQRGFAFIDLGRRIVSATDELAFGRLKLAAIDGRALDVQGIPDWSSR